MTTQEFKERWTDKECPLVPFSPARIGRFNLRPSTAAFFTEAGLPEWAAGHLDFAKDTDDVFSGVSKLTEQYTFWGDADLFDHYVVIGNCRDGDPIAINTKKNDEIEELDHEDSFNSIFFNSSIHSLAGFIVAYTDFQNSILAEHGEEVQRAGYFTDIQFDLLKTRMREIDARALEERGFWKEELEIIQSHRQKYMDNPR